MRKIFDFIPKNLKAAMLALTLVTCVQLASAQRSINISEAKVYDDRTLMIMLEQLNEQLRNINFIDRTKLAAQLGLTQGFQSKDVSRSFDISTIPIPKLTSKSTLNSDGDLAVSEQSEERSAFSPTRPALPDLPVAPTYAPVFGENASDLLDDQVNLTYQIFNLRMILERSLTDRLLLPNFKPRLIAVIGFDIDLHPPKDARDYAAYAEITITHLNGGSAPSLIALMPQEKTYNSVALNTKSTAFGGSAVAKIFTIGYSERRRGETFYLFRDTDTTTMTFPSSGNATKFGWVFRPVLGRRSVSSEKRHMFAVIALPEDDSMSQTLTYPVRIDSHTYWQKYDRSTLTTQPGEKFAEDYTLSSNLVIPNTAKAQSALSPAINSINWYATDDKNVVVSVTGDNMFTGTSVILGNSTFDTEASGLLMKSSQSLQVKTTLPTLAVGDGVLNGRYGPSIPLQFEDSISRVNTPEGVKINSFRFENENGRKFATLSLTLQNRDSTIGKNLTVNDLPRAESLIIAVQNIPLPQPYHLQDTTCNVPLSGGGNPSKQCVVIQAVAPTDLLKNENLVSFKYPFRGPKWSDFMLNYDPSEVMDVSRLGSKNKKTTLAISGRGFDNNWQIQLDKTYTTTTPGAVLNLFGNSLLTLEVDDDSLAGYKNLLVIPPVGAPIVKAIPSGKPPAPEPALDDAQPPPSVARDTGPAIEFKGTDLAAISKVTFADGKPLFSKPGKGGKSITVFLTPRVTAKAGPQFVLLWAGDTIIPAKFIVQ